MLFLHFTILPFCLSYITTNTAIVILDSRFILSFSRYKRSTMRFHQYNAIHSVSDKTQTQLYIYFHCESKGNKCFYGKRYEIYQRKRRISEKQIDNMLIRRTQLYTGFVKSVETPKYLTNGAS